MTQSAIRLEEPGRFALVTDLLPPPTTGEARVRVRRIGVCGTDIHAFHGRQPFFEYPRILGHELAVEIVELNGDSEFTPGDLVAVEPYLNDPGSPASQRGKPNCCESLRVLGVHCDGGMRAELNVPLHKLHSSAGATAEQLALVEMLSIGRHAVNRGRPTAADKVLILGAGPIGLSVLSFLKLQTDDIVVADLDETRLDFCRSAFGIKRTVRLDPNGPNRELLLASMEGQSSDLVFDATGNSGSMHSTFDLVAHGGRIVLVGLFQGDLSIHDPTFHRKEITLLASRNSTTTEFKDVIASIESGQIDTEPWITHEMSLAEVPRQFPEVISDRSLRKAIICVDE